jgi:nucleoside phosphorylase
MSHKIAVVCAMREELSAVKAGLGADAKRFELIQAGIGPRAAARVAKELAARANPPALIVSTGFCGGLVDELKVGDLVVGSEIFAMLSTEEPNAFIATKGIESGGGFEEIVYDLLRRNRMKPHKTRMMCSDQAITEESQKRDIARGGVQTVDMESYWLAWNSYYGHAKAKVIFMRAVSDAVTDRLPAEVADFLDERGKVRVGKITRFVLKRPANIARLMSLKKRADKAAASLTLAWRALREMEHRD